MARREGARTARAAPPLHAHRGARPLGLPRLFLRTKGVLSRGKSSRPRTALRAPPRCLPGARDFLPVSAGDSGRGGGGGGRTLRADPAGPGPPRAGTPGTQRGAAQEAGQAGFIWNADFGCWGQRRKKKKNQHNWFQITAVFALPQCLPARQTGTQASTPTTPRGHQP
eukprot:XP_013964969.1 uncharacterized protein LOC106558056 [Canis lupus familiaris]